jgi:hypothetical protein
MIPLHNWTLTGHSQGIFLLTDEERAFFKKHNIRVVEVPWTVPPGLAACDMDARCFVSKDSANRPWILLCRAALTVKMGASTFCFQPKFAPRRDIGNHDVM